MKIMLIRKKFWGSADVRDDLAWNHETISRNKLQGFELLEIIGFHKKLGIRIGLSTNFPKSKMFKKLWDNFKVEKTKTVM